MSRARRFLLLSALALTVAVSQPVTSVGAGSGGLTVSDGGIDVTGDIVDGDGNTVWDDTNNHVPEGSMQTGDLDWSDLGISESDVSESDVGITDGFGVQDGKGIDLNDNGFIGWSTGTSSFDKTSQSGITELSDGGLGLYGRSVEFSSIELSSNDNIVLNTDQDGDGRGPSDCTIDDQGSFTCDGDKNWAHSLNSTHESVYSSQESPEVRAVYEGKAHVDGPTNITLPSHFEKTVSDESPRLRATVTSQGAVAATGVLEKSDSWIVVDASKEVDVNYRVTGVREGYEDKQVVRPVE